MRNFNLWVLIQRSEEDHAVWIAHCLDLDIVAWASSPLDARLAVQQSVECAILDDLSEGLDPMGRAKAPPAAYAQLEHLQRVGRPVSLSADVAEREEVSKFAVIIQASFALTESTPAAGRTEPWPGPGFGEQQPHCA